MIGNPVRQRRVTSAQLGQQAADRHAARFGTHVDEVEVDEAGNLWAYLRGASPETVVVGSHLDSVAALCSDGADEDRRGNRKPEIFRLRYRQLK